MEKKLLIAVISTLLLLNAGFFDGQAIASTDNTAKVVASVSMRERPSISGDRIRYLKRGEVVDIVNKVNAYWYKVRDNNNRIGYVSTSEKYITLSSGGTSSSVTNAQIVNSVSFRTGPSTDNRRIRYLKAGEQVDVIDKINSYWYKIKDRNGTVGYVSTRSKYITTNNKDSGNTAPAKQVNASSAAKKVTESGMKYLGTPYEFGSSRNNTRTFDCSDFVRQAFLDGVGIRLPADSRKQGAYVRENSKVTTNWRQLKPGDIMFFMSYQGYKASDYTGINNFSQTITHNGIYLGDGKVLHTYSKEAGGVKIDSIDNKHWEYRFLFGGSAL